MPVCDTPRQGEWLDLLCSRPRGVLPSVARVEDHDEVKEIPLRRADAARRQFDDLKGEAPRLSQRAEDLSDPILLGLVKAEFHAVFLTWMAVHGEVCTCHLACFCEVAEECKISASVRWIDEGQAEATSCIGLEREMGLDQRLD